MTPAFNSAKTGYTVEYLDSKAENTQRFLRVYVEKAESDATVKTEMVKESQESNYYYQWKCQHVCNVLLGKIHLWHEAQVKITVTAKAGK